MCYSKSSFNNAFPDLLVPWQQHDTCSEMCIYSFSSVQSFFFTLGSSATVWLAARMWRFEYIWICILTWIRDSGAGNNKGIIKCLSLLSVYLKGQEKKKKSHQNSGGVNEWIIGKIRSNRVRYTRELYCLRS